MMYVCGDSFGVPDPDYGACWIDYLPMPVTNLSEVCASNLLIAQQVDQAIAECADFVVILFTASTRLQTKHQGRAVPYSIHSLDHTTPFDANQLRILKEYTVEFWDLELAIYQNQLIIEAVLNRLEKSKIPFLFDQGGFEHPSYGATQQYFQNYRQYRSAWNLWDHASHRSHRPYYHIVDDQIHRSVAHYYTQQYESK